jgi:hypothetical protein
MPPGPRLGKFNKKTFTGQLFVILTHNIGWATFWAILGSRWAIFSTLASGRPGLPSPASIKHSTSTGTFCVTSTLNFEGLNSSCCKGYLRSGTLLVHTYIWMNVKSDYMKIKKIPTPQPALFPIILSH